MNNEIKYCVTVNDSPTSVHRTVEPAIDDYKYAGDCPHKELGFSNGDRAGLLMARDDTGRDVTMRHELPNRDLVVPEISKAINSVEQYIHQQDRTQDFTNPMIGDGVPFERIRRITGYLVGSLDRFNNAKRAEVADRVTHGMSSGTIDPNAALISKLTDLQRNSFHGNAEILSDAIAYLSGAKAFLTKEEVVDALASMSQSPSHIKHKELLCNVTDALKNAMSMDERLDKAATEAHQRATNHSNEDLTRENSRG